MMNIKKIAAIFILSFSACLAFSQELCMMKPFGSIYKEDEDGILYEVEKVQMGETFEFLDYDLDPVTKDISVNGEILKNIPVYSVIFLEQNVYVRKNESRMEAAAMSCAPIEENAVIYKNYNLTSFMNKTLKKGTFVYTDWEEVYMYMDLPEEERDYTQLIGVEYWDEETDDIKKGAVLIRKLIQ